MQVQRMRSAVGSRPARSTTRASRLTTVQVRSANCLIVNTKGGGHAFIGLYLAKALLRKGHDVTILNDGDQSKLTSKAPFNQYDALQRSGAEIVWGSPTQPSTWPSGKFDIVYDNNGKDMESCKTLIDANIAKHYVFVASAGAYNASDFEPCHYEGDKRKSSAGHVEVESYLESKRVPFTVFQPLYIYGPHTGKDCEQWFMDRIARGRPVFIPTPGVQLTTLTHVEDVASMLAAVPGNRAAVGQHYNVCSDRCVTFVGIAKAIAKAMGKEADIRLYDPVKLGLGKSGKADGFPFRTVHFFANSDKAKRELDWQPNHDFMDDVDSLVRDYMSSGRAKKDIDFSIDDKIEAAMGGGVKKPVAAFSW